MACGPILSESRFSPSGRARTISVVAMVPPAPVRFSTTTGVPHFCCRCWPSMRAMMSVVPPAAAPARMRSDWPGRHSSALARAASNSAGAARARRRGIISADLHLQAFLADDLAPFLDLGIDEAGEAFQRTIERNAAHLGPARLYCLGVVPLLHGLVQRLGDGARRAGRGEDAEPGVHLELRQLGHGLARRRDRKST